MIWFIIFLSSITGILSYGAAHLLGLSVGVALLIPMTIQFLGGIACGVIIVEGARGE